MRGTGRWRGKGGQVERNASLWSAISGLIVRCFTIIEPLQPLRYTRKRATLFLLPSLLPMVYEPRDNCALSSFLHAISISSGK